jgi:hypothetical protein
MGWISVQTGPALGSTRPCVRRLTKAGAAGVLMPRRPGAVETPDWSDPDDRMTCVNRALANRLALSGLIWGRMTFGVGAWLAPGRVGNVLGLDMAGNPQAAYLARIVAVRDLVLACGALGTDGETQRQWLLAGLVCDGADTLAGVAATRGEYLPKRTGAYVTAFAFSGVVAAAAVLRERSSGT